MKHSALALLLLSLSTVGSPAHADPHHYNGQNLAGTWRITVTLPPGASICPPGVDPCAFAALATATSDGTAIQTAAIPAISTGHGVWTQTGPRRFTVRTTYFRYGAFGELIGTAETLTTLSLTKNGLFAEGDYANKLFDTDGNQVGGFEGTVVASRMVP